MASKGFAHQAAEGDDGEWEVLFTPVADPPQVARGPSGVAPEGNWPEPVVHLDTRDLDPPEPMVRILAATEELAPGQTLSALLGREPVFLFRELTKRGHQWCGGFTPEGDTYQLTIRVAG
jgi:TusA-related sulfurtransferase